MKKALLLVTVFLLGLAAVAQEFPRAEVSAMYSYMRFAPAAKYTSGMNLNGGGGSVTINLNQYFGLKAELEGFGASKATFTIPVGNALAPEGAVFQASGNMFTYLFGPQIKVRTPKVHPYFHALFGGVHSTVYANAYTSSCPAGETCSASGKPSQNAFGMAIGGGLDIPVSKLIGIRVGQFDYLLTRFSNPIATNNQNNFRYSAGIVFNFGNH